MHRFIFRWRTLALALPLAAMAALALLGGSRADVSLAAGPTPGPTPDLTGVSCTDTYLGSIRTGTTMSRVEPSQTSPGDWDVTTVSYLGYAGPGGLVPLDGPGPTCASTTPAASGAPEANRFGGAGMVPYANQYGARPTAVGTYTQCIGGLPAPRCSGQPDGSGVLEFSSCAYAENQGAWVRIDSYTNIVKTGKGTMNTGGGTLYLGAGAPTTLGVDLNGDGVFDAVSDGTACGATGTAFPFTSQTFSRNPRTDHTSLSKNGSITEDTDGPHPKVKFTENTNDTSDGVADDWDGDGCPDWDELDKGWMTSAVPLEYPPVYNWSTNPVNGTDPFNPYDCDLNYTATISLTTTIAHNTGQATSGNYAANCTTGGTPDCNYFGFRCLGTMTDAKTGSQRALAYRLGCYSDSSITLVNTTLSAPKTGCGGTTPNDAPRWQCGDGKSGQPPAGCVDVVGLSPTCAQVTPPGCSSLPCQASRYVYTGIDPASYPVVDAGPSANYLDTTTNQIHLGGCFAGFGGGTFGNVFGSSTIDAHTGAGSFQIYLNQTLSDCQNATPQGTPINGQVTLVVLRTEKGLTPAQMFDSDRDGCADSQELLSSPGAGGNRDPYNPNDYFNPEKTNTPNAQTVADILKVVGQYGKNQGNVLYTTSTDRTAVLGGQVYTLGAPDGQQTVADILAAVKQYNHNCAFSAP
jgi:hypothetical protein